MSDSWAVTVERNGEQVVTISSNMLAGRNLSPEDERTIENCAEHLLAFLGVSRGAPQDVATRYLELIYAVGNKYAGESRHQTALRYIQNAEQSSDTAASSPRGAQP